MKKVFISLFFILGPGILCHSQNLKIGEFSGKLYFKDEKIMDFTYLAAPDSGTGFHYYKILPDHVDYSARHNRSYLSFQQITEIEFLHFTAGEENFQHKSCQSCNLLKARIVFSDNIPDISDTVFIDTPWFGWKNSGQEGFKSMRKVELQWLDRLTIDQNR